MRETLFITAFFGAMIAGLFLFKPYRFEPLSKPVAPIAQTQPKNSVPNVEVAAPKEEKTEEEAEEVPTIYSRPTKKVIAKGKKKQSLQFNSSDYIEQKEKELSYQKPPVEEGGGMKLYLWCMEVKKDTLAYSGEKECNKLLDSFSADRKISKQLFRSNM